MICPRGRVMRSSPSFAGVGRGGGLEGGAIGARTSSARGDGAFRSGCGVGEAGMSETTEPRGRYEKASTAQLRHVKAPGLQVRMRRIFGMANRRSS